MYKVSILATLLMMFMLLPLYYTAHCDPFILGLQSCINRVNLTDFEQTTITNVPAYTYSPLLNGTTGIVINSTTTIILQQDQTNARADKGLWLQGVTGTCAGR
jgi:hypothetical protein